MKKVVLSLALATVLGLSFTSCKKSETAPAENVDTVAVDTAATVDAPVDTTAVDTTAAAAPADTTAAAAAPAH